MISTVDKILVTDDPVKHIQDSNNKQSNSNQEKYRVQHLKYVDIIPIIKL